MIYVEVDRSLQRKAENRNAKQSHSHGIEPSSLEG